MAGGQHRRKSEPVTAPKAITSDGSDPQSTCPGEAATRAADLAEELRTAAGVFCAAVRELERCTEYLVDVDRRLCAARHQAGDYHQALPPARELAAEIVQYGVRPLRPYVPTISLEAAERAENALRRGR